MSRLIYILFIFLLNLPPAIIQAQDSLSVQIDSSRIDVRSFSQDLSEKYKGDEFDYESSIEGASQNFIARALYWLIQKIGETFGVDIDPETYQVLEFILYATLIILAIYLVVRLLVGNRAAALFSKSSSKLAPLSIKKEHIEQIDLDQFIRDALSQKNYRLTVRYMYLKALKELSFQNLITWHYDKTNLDYYHEIESTQLKENFKQLSYLYDYVWYGEFDIDAKGFANAQTDFERFTKNLADAG